MRLFDLHCDTLCEGLHSGVSIHNSTGAVDLVRGARYDAWVQAYAAWIPDGLSVAEARSECDALIALFDRWTGESLCRVNTAEDLFATPAGMLTVENGGALHADGGYIHHLYDRGVRMVGLTWNGDNHWASGCFGSNRGLTSAGQQALSVLEETGIVVDVAHLNQPGFWQVEKMAHKPYVVSHTAADALCPHPRNLTDDQFCAIRDRGGIVGLTLYPEHLGGSDFDSIRRHLEHFLSLDGEKTVCFGADFDGMTAPAAWNGIAVYERLYRYLLDCGWSTQTLDAVFYINAMTFFRQALHA